MLVCLVAGAAISATFAAASGACTGSAPIVSKRGNEENNDARFSLLVRAETRSRYGARAGELATESSAFAHGSYSHATLRVPDAAMDDSRPESRADLDGDGSQGGSQDEASQDGEGE